REGRVDVHGYYLHRRIVDSSRGEDLSGVLGAWSGPTLVAQIENRARLSPQTASLVSGLEARGASVASCIVRDEPGWYFMQNPAWECRALVREPCGWLDALA